MIVTATEVTLWTNISASASTITDSGLISIVQDKITMITNNYFLTNLDIQDTYTFNATDRTIISEGNNFEDYNFLADDDIFVYGSYRNDGYYTISSVSTSTLTLITGSSVVDELSGASILISVVKYPNAMKYVAAQMIKYDYDDRPAKSAGVKSRALGPWSESYGTNGQAGEMPDGYPAEIIEALSKFTITRLM